MRTLSPRSAMLHYIRNALCIAPIFVLAGCWQKIEYTPAVAEKKLASPAVTTDEAKTANPPDVSPPITVQDSSPIANVANIPPAPEFQPPPATPIAAAPTAAKPNPVNDDRYAIPAKSQDTAAPSRFAANDTQPAAPPEQQSPRRHTDATPVSAAIAVVPPSVTPKIRRAIWTLGSRL